MSPERAVSQARAAGLRGAARGGLEELEELGPGSCPSVSFLGEGSPTKIDYTQLGALSHPFFGWKGCPY